MSPRGQQQNEQMRAETLAKITGAAMRALADNGYHGTTMKQIAAAAELSHGLVYYYFPSKEELFRHLVDVALDASNSTLSMAFDVEGTAWEKLEHLSAVLVRDAFKGEASLYFIVMLQAMTQGKSIPGLMDHIQRRSADHFGKIVPLVAQAQESGDAAQGDAAVLTATYFAFVQGLALLVSSEPGMADKITPGMVSNVLRSRG